MDFLPFRLRVKVAPRVSSGILAAAWQQLQVQTQLVRRQKRAARAQNRGKPGGFRSSAAKIVV